MSASRDILKEISNLLSSQPKYFLWVPIVTLAIGAGAAFLQHFFTKT